MRKSLILRQQLRDSIKSEIADRTRIHQAKIAAFRTARARPLHSFRSDIVFVKSICENGPGRTT